MNTLTKRHRFTALAVLVATVIFSVAFTILIPSPAPAAPTIIWTPVSVNETILAGESKNIAVSFTASENLTNAVIRVVPELELYVKVRPAEFQSIAKGQTINLTLSISTPATSLPATFEGTIQLRSATSPQKTFARPLPVTLIVIANRFTNQEGGYSILIPPAWLVSRRADDSESTILIPPEKSANPSMEYIGDMVVDRFSNPNNLSINQFYQLAGNINLFEASNSNTPFQLNGLEAVRFTGVMGMLPSTVVAIRIDGAIIEITDVNESHQTDGVFDLVVSSLIPLK